MTTLFISDLHLDSSRPDITAQFLEFLDGEARTAKALYILGDLFEVWIGDDDPDPEKRRIMAALRRLTDSGVQCAVMHGNRDFLIGARFASETGCSLIPDGTLVNLYGQPVLLMHGDTLCTDDRSYQLMRRIVRNPVVQWILLHRPLRYRRGLAWKIRAWSKAHMERAPSMIMDVNAGAVARAFAEAGVDTLVHGHTHRPAIHRLQAAGRAVTRIVLGDWYTQGSVLSWDEHGYELVEMDRS